jgi:teichuronic acid exporter
LSFKKSFFKNILTFGGYNYTSQIANFLSTIVLSRLLLPAEYGYVALITVFTGFVVIFADAGLSMAIVRSDYGRTFHRAMTNLSFYIGLILFILMLLLAYPIALFYNDVNLVLPTMVMSLTFIVGAFKIVPMSIYTKQLDFNFVGKVRLIANLLSIGLMIVLAFLGFSYWSLIIPQIFLHLWQYVMFERRLKLGFRFYPFSYSIVAFRKTRSLITNLSGFNLVNYWARNADNLLIGKLYSSYDLGIYSRAYKLLLLSLNLISGIFGTVLYPSLKKYESEGGDIRAEYASILGVISLINYPVGAILILFPKIFVRLLWGNDWIMVADLLPYFGLLIFFQTMISTSGHMYILLEREQLFMKVGIATSVLMVAAIAWGAMHSMLMVAIAYTFCFMVVIVPINLYYGFIKAFGYKWKFIFQFWLPKVITGLAILISIYLSLVLWQVVFMLLLLAHILFYQRKDLINLARVARTRIRNK